MIWLRVFIYAILVGLGPAATLSFNENGDCLDKDSSPCAQNRLLRNLKRLFFGVAGVVPLEEATLDKEGGIGEFVYYKKSTEQPIVTEELNSTRNLRVSYPLEDDKNSSSVISEGRGKKLKKLLPLLILLKIQYFIYGVAAFVLITLIAKAALLKGSLALALAGVFLLRRLLSGPLVYAQTEVQFNSEGGGSWETYDHVNQHKQYSNNNAHTVAYKGQRPVRGG